MATFIYTQVASQVRELTLAEARGYLTVILEDPTKGYELVCANLVNPGGVAVTTEYVAAHMTAHLEKMLRTRSVEAAVAPFRRFFRRLEWAPNILANDAVGFAVALFATPDRTYEFIFRNLVTLNGSPVTEANLMAIMGLELMAMFETGDARYVALSLMTRLRIKESGMALMFMQEGVDRETIMDICVPLFKKIGVDGRKLTDAELYTYASINFPEIFPSPPRDPEKELEAIEEDLQNGTMRLSAPYTPPLRVHTLANLPHPTA